MPICSKCGAELDEAAKFCMECGTPVSQNKKCVKCGAELPNNAMFCFSCGAPQDVATPIAEKAEPKNNAGESSDSEENIVGKNKSSDIEETFTDPRDGEVYKTCKIGNQVWMAENLRYRCKKGGSYAYDDDASNVKKYGRLYTWDAAKEACPPGWHLPSREDWQRLVDFVAKEYCVSDALRAEEWSDGIDAFGFSALPAGYRIDYNKVEYNDRGETAQFWSSTKGEDAGDSGEGYFFNITPQNDETSAYWHTDTDKGCSVRCIKDAPIEIQCDFCKKTFNASKNPIKTFEQEYIDGSPIQKKDIIKRMCYGCQNTIGRDFIKKQAKLERKYKKQ